MTKKKEPTTSNWLNSLTPNDGRMKLTVLATMLKIPAPYATYKSCCLRAPEALIVFQINSIVNQNKAALIKIV